MSETPWFKPTGVLDPNKHGRLIDGRVKIAADAHSIVDTLSTFVQSIARVSLS